MLEIKRTGSEEYGKSTKVLICGDAGAGKTLISSTWPNPVYASAEGGLMSIADRDIPYTEIRKSEDLLRLKNALDQPAEVREEMLGFPVQTVVVDTIDEIQRILMKERLDSQRREGLQMQDWGWLNEQMQAIVRGFRNLDLHVIFTCHLKESTDQESGRVSYRPGLSGAIADSIPSYVDLALRLDVSTVTDVTDDGVEKRQVRSLISTPDHAHSWIKDRSGKLPERLDVNFEDDYDRIAELIFGNVKLQDTQVLEIDDSATAPAAQPEAAPAPAKKAPAKKAPAKKAPAKKAPAKAKAAPVASAGSVETPTVATADDDKDAEKSTEDDSEKSAKPRNKLPDDVTPVAGGHDTNIFCVTCGNEVESEDQAELSRIRFRKILCKTCFADSKQ